MYFKPQYLSFFNGLQENNNRNWFHEHQDEYIRDVKQPFSSFISTMIEKTAVFYPSIHRNPAKCIFRINRDIRFSKEKSPYKLNMAAVLAPGGTKERIWPTFYIHFGTDQLMIGGGIYFADKQQINQIRQEIYYRGDEFTAAITHPDFVASFGDIKGDKNKILPAPYREAVHSQPLLANKQWWYFRALSPDDLYHEDLADILCSHFSHAIPLHKFFTEALNA